MIEAGVTSVEQPAVSVVVPCYNKAPFVRRTLDSVAAQSFRPLEVIVVDDCSSDDSVQIIEDWAASAPIPCTVVKHRVNRGVCGSSNSGLSRARGEFVVFLDGDDRLLPHMIEAHVRRLREAVDAGMVYGDAVVEDAGGQVVSASFLQLFRGDERPEGMVFQDLLVRLNFLPASAMTVRASALERVGWFDESLPFQDYDMWLRIARHSPVLFSGSVDAGYTVSPSSLSKTIGERFFACYLMTWEKWRRDPAADTAAMRRNAANCVLGLAGRRAFTLRSAAVGIVRGCSYYRDPLLPLLSVWILTRVAVSRALRGQ